MTKRMELSEPESCINKAEEDEPVFVLLGRDSSAPIAVEMWVDHRLSVGKNKEKDPEIVEAMALAAKMRAWRKRREAGKR